MHSDERTNQGNPEKAVGPTLISVLLVIAAVVAAISLWRMGSNLGQQACVQKTLAQYPAVSVSAYDNPKDVGALKISYDAERRNALKSC